LPNELERLKGSDEMLVLKRRLPSSCEEVKYEFLHQLLQDYLAARGILTSEDIDQVMFFEKHQEDIRFHQTLIFFAGLSKLQSTKFQRVFEQNLDLINGPFQSSRGCFQLDWKRKFGS